MLTHHNASVYLKPRHKSTRIDKLVDSVPHRNPASKTLQRYITDEITTNIDTWVRLCHFLESLFECSCLLETITH